MAVFHYYSGEAVALALDGDCIVVDDAQGRRWYCVRSAMPSLAGYTVRDLHESTFPEVYSLFRKLMRNGMTPTSTVFGVMECAEATLRDSLSAMCIRGG